ncbi:murein hydrolase activator EnvC family protein [Aquisalinus luteolus]|nr:peptidoglycan DD-metalloendopeptidase family protein [Aquisalinus luteolus]
MSNMMKPRLLLSLLATAALAAPVASPLGAQQDEDEQQRRLNEIEEQLQSNERNAAEIRELTPAKREELEALRTRLIETADSLQKAETRTTAIEQRLEELETEEKQVGEELEEQQRATSEILAALQSFELAKPPALAVSPQDASQAARAAMALSGIVPDLQSKVEDLRANMELILSLQQEMAAEKEALEESEVQLTSRRNALEDLLDRKTAEFRDVTDRITELERENDRLAREATSIRNLLDDLAEAARRREEEAALANLPEPEVPDTSTFASVPGLDIYNDLPAVFADARGKLPYPVSGRVVAPYASEMPNGGRLEGLRLETRAGAVVTAPFNGSVVFAQETYELVGNVFILDVGGGYKIVLVGMERFEAGVGQFVRAGEPLGYMPADGNRAVLYMEIRRNAEPQNPTAWLLDRG